MRTIIQTPVADVAAGELWLLNNGYSQEHVGWVKRADGLLMQAVIEPLLINGKPSDQTAVTTFDLAAL